MIGLKDLPDNGWRELLRDEVESRYFKRIASELRQRVSEGRKVYPERSQVFRALELCPPGAVRVVIVGQDPYHGPEQANGLSFSVNRGARIPPSLQNIFQEAGIAPSHGDLTAWAEQGVLLLNSILTVERGRPGSHAEIGWQRFTDAILKVVCKQDRPIVFVLWGQYAQEKANNIKELDNFKILRSPHPSPYSARLGFFGNGHFSLINEYFDSLGLGMIDWRLHD